jgi:hypothetical protein
MAPCRCVRGARRPSLRALSSVGVSERSLAMWWVDIVGYAAALAVLGSFCMSTIVPLRILAVVSNVLFGVYGVLAHLYPVFFLHTILLPINLFKLARTGLSAEARRVSGPILPQAGQTE